MKHAMVTARVCRWLCVAALALIAAVPQARAACTRAPDEITDPRPDPPQLIAPDPKNRDFEFYDGSYALVIGQSDYKDRPKLAEVPDEMRNLKAVLEKHHFLVSLYLNLDSDNLEPVISCFIKSVPRSAKARVLIFFAGHGDMRAVEFSEPGATLQIRKRVGYVLPTDIPRSTDDPDFIRKALPISQFRQWAEVLEVKHVLFIFDSCVSGLILESRGGEPPKPRPSSYVFSDPVQLPLRQFLTSGSGDQPVPSHSFFLTLLVQALLGNRDEADVNKDGFLTGAELVSFLQGFLPIYVPKQTPAAGRIKDPDLDRGEFIFQLPQLIGATIAGQPTMEPVHRLDPDQPVLIPVFRGAIEGDDKAIAQLYELKQILNTAVQGCGRVCDPARKAQHHMRLDIPPELPAAAEFTEPELKCQGCTKAFKITVGPGLSPDRRKAEVGFESWEASAVWQFTAKILVPRTGPDVLVVNTAYNNVVSVDPNQLSVIGASPAMRPELAAGVKDVILDMQSDDSHKRHQARIGLAKYIAGDDGSLVTQLVRGMITGTYRYQLGMAEALARTPNGWKTNESTSKEILLAAQQKTRDAILRASIERALANLRVSVYYAVGPDGWLTKAGQLKPTGIKKPPLPAYANLIPGTILQADSSVYMRAGPGISFGVVGTLPAAACVRVVQPEKGDNDQPLGGGWLQVVRAQC